MLSESSYPPIDRPPHRRPYAVAVIDVGTTSLRMEIAEIHPDGRIRKLASYSQAVSLGKDAFSKRRIEKRTIEDCVHVLQTYRAQLNELGIDNPDRIRVIATNAVAESTNRLAMLDRIFVATGFEIELIDDAELHRVTYLGVLPAITENEKRFKNYTVVCEVSGGATEFLLLDGSDVVTAHSFRQGSLRLKQMVESVDAPRAQYRVLLESRIRKLCREISRETDGVLGDDKVTSYIAMGGDIRFAATQVKHKRIDDRLIKLSVADVELFLDEILQLSEGQIANKFHISLPDAASLAPALLCHTMIAKQTGASSFFVAESNVRDGLITEMAQGRRWSSSIQKQILRSASNLGRKFHYRENYAKRVAEISVQLFDGLHLLHQLGERFRGILEIAATLHEVGVSIATRSYHKHTMYLIRHSELFGIGSHDLELVALVARYHRRATPQPSHDGYSRLSRKDRVAVSKLAAILRVAKALNQSAELNVDEVNCRVHGDRVIIDCAGLSDVSVERAELKQNGRFFEDIYGKRIQLSVDQASTPLQ
ncbi:MAG: exopolyphosphatase [Planctomycetota bacterium]